MPRQPDDDLHEIDAAGLRRRLRVLDSAQGAVVRCGGRDLHNFSSNDYLGLASHPALIEAAAVAARTFGFGSGSSRLICGTMRPHTELEDALADFKQSGAALVFGSGFAAGSGAIPSLAGKEDIVILDKLAHACLIDGARASGATLRVFGHNRIDQLEAILKSSREKSPDARILVVTEAVFSMDGDLAPLAEIVELKDTYGAMLLLDEAHATGVLGPDGRGLAASLGLSARIDVHMGTLSKAFGCHGGFIAGSRDVIDLLINRARSFIFATAPPPPLAAAALAALTLVASADGEARRAKLERNRHALARSLGLAGPSPSAIQPVIIGGEADAVAVAARLESAGVLVPAIRFPTVPMGSARLRFTVTASHDDESFAALAALAPGIPVAGG